MPVGEKVFVSTPFPEKYMNDCLHPCVRKLNDSSFVMIQSPYYGEKIEIENPIFYCTHNIRRWENGVLLADTPERGYHSDPVLFSDEGSIFCLWRDCGTQETEVMQFDPIVVCSSLEFNDGVSNLCDAIPIIGNTWKNGDLVQCPIVMKHKDSLFIYAAWYQYYPERKDLGIAIWSGTSLSEPDFVLRDTIPLEMPHVCDKRWQLKIFGHLFFFPCRKKYDMWHFDLFEYNSKLYIVSSGEKSDNIMLSCSDDWVHFRTFRKPLINSHYSENTVCYRQYYYKPSAIIDKDSLYLFYTSNSKDEYRKNDLLLSVTSLNDIKGYLK